MKAVRLICLTLAGTLAGAAAAGVLFGTVKNSEGKPVSGAQVTVYGKDISAKTDASGTFRIENEDLIDGNRYSVSVDAEGYDQGQTLSAEVFKNEKDMEPIEVELSKTEPIPEPDTNTPAAVEGALFVPEAYQPMLPPEMTNMVSDDLIPGLTEPETNAAPAAGTNAAAGAAK